MATINQAKFSVMHGVSRKTVTGWKKRGWIVLQGDLVDVDASNALLEKYRTGGSVTRASKGNSSGNTLPKVKAGESAEQAVERFLTHTGATMTIDEAKRVKENYLALLNQLEYDTESGLVVLVSEVAKAVGEEYAKVRTRLLAIPAEQAPRVHRLKTVSEVQDVLRELITEALEELTHD